MTAPSLGGRLGTREPAIGGILRMPNEALMEAGGHAGLAFVVVDLEHGPADHLALQHHLAAAECSGLEVLVRVGSADPVEIQRVLDLGALGIVVPHVRSADEAQAVVRAAHYPPMGVRGIAAYTRAGRYGLGGSAAEHARVARGRTTVVVMLEDPDACAAADEILAVDGVDAVFVGPADLTQSVLASGGDIDEVPKLIGAVHDVARTRGRLVMSIVSTRDAARDALDAGADLVLYNLQSMISDLLREVARP